ncbi:protein of unknown function [Pseudomonas mediterranea]
MSVPASPFTTTPFTLPATELVFALNLYLLIIIEVLIIECWFSAQGRSHGSIHVSRKA